MTLTQGGQTEFSFVPSSYYLVTYIDTLYPGLMVPGEPCVPYPVAVGGITHRPPLVIGTVEW